MHLLQVDADHSNWISREEMMHVLNSIYQVTPCITYCQSLPHVVIGTGGEGGQGGTEGAW